MITSSVKNQIGDSQLTIEFLDRYKPLEIERAALQEALQAYATLPAAVVVQLEDDQASTSPPSALQARMLQWLRDVSPQPG